MKSKETSNYIAEKLLTTHSMGSNGYYLCPFI